MNSKIKLIIVIASFALVFVVAYMTYGSLSQSYKENDNAVVQPSPTQTIKSKAADFTVVDKNNKSVKLSSFFGKPMVVNFWASWCPPCKRELPDFNTVYEDLKGKVTFMMVDLTDGQRETVDIGKNFISSEGYTFPVYYDINSEASYAYSLSSIPSTIFIDREGNIVKSQIGAMDEATLRSWIELIK